MAETYNITDIMNMYQADYEPGLISALQCAVNVMEDKCKIFHMTGKETELNYIGSTEMEFQTKRLQEKTWDELTYKKRYMRDGMLVKSLIISEDDFIHKGKFAITVQNLQDELVHAAKRAMTWMTLGVTFKKDPEANAHIVPATPKNAGDAGLTSPYSTTGIYRGGLFGLNQISDDDGSTRIEEEFPQQPMLTTGALSTGEYVGYTKSGDIDMEKTNVIPSSYVLTGTPVHTNVTLTKLRAAREALESRDAIRTDEYLYMMVTPRQISALYNNVKLQKECGWQIYKDGIMSDLLGMKLVQSNYVPKVKVGNKWVRSCPVWARENLGFGLWDGIKLSAYKLDQRFHGGIGVDVRVAVGAARLRTEAILAIHCDEDGESED